MNRVGLRPMRAEEWGPWHEQQGVKYVDQLVGMGGYSPADAEMKAVEDGDRLLPDGFATPGHRFLVAEVDGRGVGWLWLGASDDPATPDVVWIYDIEIDPDSRGQGIGRAVMILAEDEVRTMGGTSIMLNVFAGNDLAIGLYDSLGYTVVETRPSGQNMAKILSS